MPYIEFILPIAAVFLVAAIGFHVVRGSASEPFMAAVIERFRADGNAAPSIDLKRRFYGWLQAGSAVARTSGTSKIAVDEDAIYIAQLPLVNKLMPTLRIPLSCLTCVDSRFYWSAMSRLDTFEIDGISTGQLLLPVGLVAGDDKQIDKPHRAT